MRRQRIAPRVPAYLHPLYPTWWGMIRRCEEPTAKGYCYYGARGIRVCERWKAVETFLADIEAELGPRPDGHTLDRINPNGHYEPGNVRWATQAAQATTRRGTILVELDGKPMALRAACKRHLGLTEVQYGMVWKWLREGRSFDSVMLYYQVSPSRIKLLQVTVKMQYAPRR